jgi:hypothetical protein
VKPDEQGIRRLLERLSSGGLPWVRRRLLFELASPTTRLGKWLNAAARRGLATVLVPFRQPNPAFTDTLLAFYDLKVSPITFDFLWFLAAADLTRRRVGARSVHVVIVPGTSNGVRAERDDYEDVISPEARRLRLFNLTIPATSLLPSTSGLTLAGTRAEAALLRRAATHVYPAGYETTLPTFMHPSECLDAARRDGADIAVLRAPQAALNAVDRWLAPRLGDRHLIVITLRHYAYMPARNSRVAEWTDFARSLDPKRFFVVFVPDTNQTLDLPTELEGITVFNEAAWNLALRMALYQRAFINLGVNNGPMGLCWLNARTRYITLRMRTESVPQTTLAYIASLGFEPHRSLPFATPFQKLLWDEPDTVEVIRREFDLMTAALDDTPAAPSEPAEQRTSIF